MKHSASLKRSFAGLAAVALLAAGCATSGGKDEESSSSAEEASSARESTSSSREQQERGRLEVRKRVHFEEILGNEIRRDRPPGCSGSWSAVGNSPFAGQAYFCSEFNGPEKWGDIPVTMVVQEDRLSVISVQIFFEGNEGAKAEYEDFTGNLIGRCDRVTGFERYEVYDCSDYVVDVSWRAGHDSAQVKVVYARSMESLKKKKRR